MIFFIFIILVLIISNFIFAFLFLKKLKATKFLSKKIDFFSIESKNFLKKINDLEKKNEKQIQTFLDLIEYSPDGIILFDQNAQMILFNHSFLKIWGIDSKYFENNKKFFHMDFIDKMINENKISPKDLDEFRNWHIEIFTSLKEPYNEFFHLNDGRTIRMLIIPSKDQDGFLFVYQDLTDRLKIKMELNSIEALLENVLNLFEKPILIFKQNFKIYFYNNEIKNLLKKNIFEEIESKSLYYFFENFHEKPENLNEFLIEIYNFAQNSNEIELRKKFLKFQNDSLNLRVLKISRGLIVIFFEINSLEDLGSFSEKKKIYELL